MRWSRRTHRSSSGSESRLTKQCVARRRRTVVLTVARLDLGQSDGAVLDGRVGLALGKAVVPRCSSRPHPFTSMISVAEDLPPPAPAPQPDELASEFTGCPHGPYAIVRSTASRAFRTAWRAVVCDVHWYRTVSSSFSGDRMAIVVA